MINRSNIVSIINISVSYQLEIDLNIRDSIYTSRKLN